MNTQRGNVLFLILVAVVLFAALSYAVTQSSRGGGGVSKEQAKITASELIQMSTNMKFAVDRMRARGLGVEDIQINTTTYNTPCTTGDDCIFAPEGGGLPLPEPHQDIADVRYVEPGNGYYVIGMGTNAADLFIVFDVTEEVCTAINEGLGLSTPPESSPVSSHVGGGTSYSGVGVFCEGYSYASTNYSFVHTLAYQ